MKRFFVIILLLIKLTSSLEVDFSCPNEVYSDSEFECGISIPENRISYDVKLILIENKTRINQIWNGEAWQRSDWYTKELINSENSFIRTRIINNVSTNATYELKIRESLSQKIVYEKKSEIRILIKTMEDEINEKNKAILLNSKGIKTTGTKDLIYRKILNYSGIMLLGLLSLGLYLLKDKNDRKRYQENTFGSDC